MATANLVNAIRRAFNSEELESFKVLANTVIKDRGDEWLIKELSQSYGDQFVDSILYRKNDHELITHIRIQNIKGTITIEYDGIEAIKFITRVVRNNLTKKQS